MRRWWIAVGLVLGSLAAVLPASTAAAAAPTCTPGAPAVVGSGADRLTISVPGCATEAGVTGYRIQVLATAAEVASTVDVPIGTTQREVTGLSAGTLYRFRVAATNADGAGPWSARSADAIPPFTSTSALVDRQALDFTTALPSASERAVWVEQLGSGGNVASDVVAAFEQSAYWQKQSPVIRLFQAYFLRLPDKSGLAYWTGKYRNGTKISTISQSFASSSEFTRRYGTLTNRKFVEQIYLNVLGRPGEASGIDYWTGKLDSKAKNRGEVMVGFSESSEYKRKTDAVVWTVNLFTGMLLRLPTTAEVDTWKPQTKVALITSLLGTPAYAARVAVTAPGAPPGITTTSLANGRIGAAYSASLAATGGAGGNVWSKPSGSLPAGLTLSSAGVIGGTPTAAGTSTFAVKVTDSAGRSTQRNLSITVTAFSITTSSLPAGVISSPYSATLAATGGTGALSWSIQSGTLPPPLTLSSAGTISGTPTTGGTSNVTFKVTDSTGATATRALSLTISTFGITTASLPNGVVATDYSVTLQAVGGTGTLTWSATGLPDGLGVFDGQIVGQPYQGGTFTPTITVQDETGAQRSRQYSMTVPVLAVATTSLPGGTITAPYSTKLAAVNGYYTLTWSLQSGSLPAGLSLDPDGTISGTPTAGGTSTFTVKVADQYTSTATKSLSISISSFAITTQGIPGGYTAIPYVAGLEAAGGSGYAWSISAGALPAGLALDGGTGVISGTPTGSGSSTFTAKVDATGGKTASKQFTIAIGATADWPQQGHDGGQSGWNPGETAINASNVTGLREEWSVPALESPAIVGDRVYAADEVPGRSGTYAAMALDLLSGELVWAGPRLPDGCTSGPVAVTATAVIVGCGRLLSYARTGSHALQWDTASTDPGSSIQNFTVVGATAYTWQSDRVAAYRLSDGQRLWQLTLPSGATSINGLAASSTNVVVTYDDRIRSVSPTTGAQQWSKTVSGASAVMIGGSSAYAVVGGGLVQYALGNGTPGWTVPAGSGIYQLVGVDADTAYAFEARFGELGQESAVLHAYRVSDGTERWSANLSTRIRASAITSDLVWTWESQIFAWGRYSALIAFRRSDGVELERHEFDDNAYGSAAFGNGHVAVALGGSAGGSTPAQLRAYGFSPPSPTISTAMVPTGRVGAPYGATLEATGGSGSITWAVTSGTLPSGLALSSGGELAGTPTAAASTWVTIRATDAKGRSRSRSLHIEVVVGGTNGWSTEGQGSARTGANLAEATISRDSAAQLAFRWKTATPAGTEQSLVVDHSPVVVGTRVIDVDKIGRLAASSTTGTTADRAPQWTLTALDGAYYPDAPTEAGGVLYLFDSNRNLDAVRASDGVRLWHVTLTLPPNQYQRSEILVVGTKVLFLDGQYDLVARNTSDGSAAWSGAAVALDGNELFGSVVLASDGTRAFVVANCEVKAITISSGAVAWTVSVKEGGTTNCGTGTRMTPMVADGAVFASTYDGSIAIEAATGAVRWRAGARGGYANGGGVIANGVWVMGTDDAAMVALDIRTGDVRWKQTSGVAYAGYATAGDLLVARGTYGMQAFDLLTGALLSDLGAPDASSYTWGAPTIAAGKIFVSTRDGVRAYGLP